MNVPTITIWISELPSESPAGIVKIKGRMVKEGKEFTGLRMEDVSHYDDDEDIKDTLIVLVKRMLQDFLSQ